jgi:hypothetical protein
MNEPSPLGDYLDRLEWSAERLVREINRISGPGTTTAKAPYAWIKGSCPRGRLPETVASILSGQLGEHITAEMLWPKRARETLVQPLHLDLDLPWTQRGAWQAAGLLSDHLIGPSPIRPPVLPGPSLVGPALDWLTADDEEPSSQQVGRQIVGPEAVQVLRDRIGQLRRLDDAQGGPLVLEWVTQDLRWAASLVHNGSYDPVTGIELHGVVAELAQLAGWLACDQGRAGIGQRYLLAGLHFAHTALDSALGANIVSCLSYQAMWSGEHQDALRLIRAARKGAGGPPVVSTLYSPPARHAPTPNCETIRPARKPWTKPHPPTRKAAKCRTRAGSTGSATPFLPPTPAGPGWSWNGRSGQSPTWCGACSCSVIPSPATGCSITPPWPKHAWRSVTSTAPLTPPTAR